MVRHFLLTTLITLVSLPVPAAGGVRELYEEVDITNKKIEARLAEWNRRAAVSLDNVNISANPKIVTWREQLIDLDLSDEKAGLERLNQLVNETVVYRADYDHFGKADYWGDQETTLTEGGDCEDIALVKAAILYRFGWPKERKKLLVGILTERGKKEYHAVLMVETSAGEKLIMRSINNQVVHPDEFGFLPIYGTNSNGTVTVKLRDPDKVLNLSPAAE